MNLNKLGFTANQIFHVFGPNLSSVGLVPSSLACKKPATTQTLREGNTPLKLKPTKCHFTRKEIHYLGHVINMDGVSPVPGEVQAVINWPKPQIITKLRSFLGFVRYYRSYIHDFAKIASIVMWTSYAPLRKNQSPYIGVNHNNRPSKN